MVRRKRIEDIRRVLRIEVDDRIAREREDATEKRDGEWRGYLKKNYNKKEIANLGSILKERDTTIEDKRQDSLKFLTELGLKIPDIHAEVKELILPKYQKDDVTKDKEYFDDFIKILEAYNSIPSNERDNFKGHLLGITFISA